MIIREERKEDFDDISQVTKEAFNQVDESELIKRLRHSRNFVSRLSLVAIRNRRIIGHILFSKIKIIGDKEYETLALAPMAVVPEFQKQGIGSSLIIEGLKRARELGFDSVIVLGHKEYYLRFGFEKASKWNIKCPFNVPDEVFMALELKNGALTNKSGVVRYPKEFDPEKS